MIGQKLSTLTDGERFQSSGIAFIASIAFERGQMRYSWR